MTDALGWRAKFGVLAPSTNTIVEPDFYRMCVPGVTAHFSRIHIRNQNLSDDAAFEALLGQVRQEIGYAVERVMTAEPDYMVMGMSSETFWGGVEGNRQFIQQIKALSGGLGVATGAEACERALHRLGARRLGVVTPYQPVGDANVVRFFNEIGFDVVKIKGLRCPTAVSIAHVQEAALRQALL
jgi:maleate isomerase